jgi:hypothetical protein
MLLRSDESPAFVTHGMATTSAEPVTVHDEVERLIAIAGQLISAIEWQIHCIEESLTTAQEEKDSSKSRTVLKEHLIRAALDLNNSLREIAARLEDRSEPWSSFEQQHDGLAN